ncbi:MAG: autotransporter-associated beta strand repeat-containing protein [Pirellulales bacterium]
MTIAGGTTTLRSANTYTGPTTITGGTLKIGVGQAVPNNSATTIDTAGTLEITGFNQTLSSLSGGGTVRGTTVSNLTLSSGTFSGLLDGAFNLIKQNAGTFTLSGTTNTFTGTLEPRNGTLVVSSLGDSGAGANGAGAIRILNGTNTTTTLRYVAQGA